MNVRMDGVVHRESRSREITTCGLPFVLMYTRDQRPFASPAREPIDCMLCVTRLAEGSSS